MTAMGKAWTYSSLEAFETCPRQFHEVRVLRRFREAPSVHAAWGDQVHDGFESCIKEGTPLPEGMQQWQTLATKLRAIPGRKLTEVKLAIDECFQPVDYWGNAWSRGKADLVVLNGAKGALLDYKTGKPKPSEQLMLYAGYAFAQWPELDELQTAFVWLKTRQPLRPVVFHRSDMPRIQREFIPRVRRMELAHERNDWPPRPSGLCNGWCAVTDCEHHKSKT